MSVFSSIVELKQNEPQVFLKGNIFHCVVRSGRMKSKGKFMQHAILLYCPFLFIENFTLPSTISFPMNMEGSKRTNTRIRHNLMAESLLSNNTSNRFQSIMTPARGKTYGLHRRNGTITLPSRKARTVDNMFL